MFRRKKLFHNALIFIVVVIELVSNAFGSVPPQGGTPTQAKNAKIEGFKSAKFGMVEKEIYSAISEDFNIFPDSVEKFKNPLEKTTSLSVTVPELLEKGGKAKIVYIFGYKTKQLIQINVIWGKPTNKNPDMQEIVATANLLQNYLLQKGFKKDKFIMNMKLRDGSILFFRGSDNRGRMVILILENPQEPKYDKNDGANPDLSLRLSYIADPNNPDIFKIYEGEF